MSEHNDVLELFSTAGSTYDTELSVWNGSKQVGCNDDYSGGTSQLYLYLTKGKAYQIAVDGFNGQMGQLRFSVS